MSDDVITLDSSDEESKPENKKPKLKTPTKHPKIKNLPKSQTRPAVSVNNQINQLRPVIGNSTVYHKIKGPNPNPFNTQIRNSLNNNKVRPIHIKQNAIFQSKNFTPLPIGNSFGPVQPFFQGKQFNNINFVNAPLSFSRNISLQAPKMQRKPVKMPIIVNARTLSNAQKKTDSQNFISALPAGITVTRTSSKSTLKKTSPFPDIVVKRNSQVINPLTILKPPEITTVELDDDEDDYNQVGDEIPVEFDFAVNEKKKITEKDKHVKEKEKTSVTVEVSSKDGSSKESLESNKHDRVIVDNNKNISDEPVNEDIVKNIRKTVIAYYTPKKNESEEAIAKDNKAVKKVIIDVIELTDSPVKCCNDNSTNPVKNEDILDDNKSVETNLPACLPKLPPLEKMASPSRIDTPTVKAVEVTIVMKPDDVKKVEEYIQSSPKKVESSPSDEGERKINDMYQKFIDLCFKLDKSDDMEKIIRKRVKGYYMLVHPSFTESRSFCKYVEGKISEISSNPGSLFLYIKDVVDELKVRRIKTKRSSAEHKSPERSKRDKEQEEVAESEGEAIEDDEEDSVINNRIHKLERAMRKLSKAIEKLEEKEIDYDDEENSAYLLADRYKNRLVRIYRKLCTLTGERDEARRSASVRGLSRLVLCGGRMPRLTAAVKAAAISRPNWFPDYIDVYKCVEHCAKEQDLALRPDELQREAREAFVEIGTLLQQRRREQEYEELSWRLGSHSDPAEKDPVLAAALLNNREQSKHREMEVINKFAEKQSSLRLEAEVVQDADADKSDGSSEESEDESNNHIEENSNSPDKNTANEKNNIGESSKTVISDDVKRDDVKCDKTQDDDKEASCSATLTEICDYLRLEKQPPKVTEEISRKRKFTEDDDGSDNSVSSCLSFIELNSSDSQESTKSKGDNKRKCNGDFKRLKSIRPSSAMSGINVIEDGSSHSCSKFENITQSKSSSDIVMEVEDSNDAIGVTSKQCDILESESLVEDDNAVDGALPKENLGSGVCQDLVIEDKDEKGNKDCIDITDKELDYVCTAKNDENNKSHDKVPNETTTELMHIIDSDRETHETYPTDDNNLLQEICVKSTDPESLHRISKKHKTDAEKVIVTLDDENYDVDKNNKQTYQGDRDNEVEGSCSDEKNLLQAISEKDSDVNDQPTDTNHTDDVNNRNQRELVARVKNNADKLCQDSVNGVHPDDDDVELVQEFYEGEIDVVEHDITS